MKKITDKMRLDWIGKRGLGTTNFTPQMGPRGGVYFWDLPYAVTGRERWFKSVRAGIDAAIRAALRAAK